MLPQRYQPSSPRPMGIPKAKRQIAEQGKASVRRPATCQKDIDELLQRGIPREGTRLDTTKQIAWHFIFVRGLSEEAAADEIIDWAYRTGKDTSKDIQADLKHGTHKVAEQTRQVVAWYAARRREGGVSGSRRFSTSEIDAIVAVAANLPVTIQPARIHFAIDFLNFAKRQGMRHESGWACCPSVRGIVRKWKGCSGMRYKPHLDWAMEVGLIAMIRDKWQPKNGPGRARTYVIHLPHGSIQDQTLNYTAAIEYAGQRVRDGNRG